MKEFSRTEFSLPGAAAACDPATQVSVAILAPDPDDLSPALRFLIDTLHKDDRFRLQAIVAAPEKPHREGALFKLERALVRSPERVKPPEIPTEIARMPSEGAGLAPFNVVVDLHGCVLPEALGQQPLWHLPDLADRATRASLLGDPATEVELVSSTSTGATRVLNRMLSDTKPLATLNVSYVEQKAVQLLLHALARLAAHGEPAVPADALPKPRTPQSKPGGYAAQIARHGLGRLRERHAVKRAAQFQPFRLRIGTGDYETFAPETMRDVPAPANSYWADPFLFAHDGATYCFFEDLDAARGLAHISVGRVTDAGLEDVRVALRLPVHMSYPFVFAHEGEIFMMPEVHAAGRLEIWRAVRFPDHWELHATAFEGQPVVDSTLLKRSDGWWLFTHHATDTFGDYCNALHLYQLSGPDLAWVKPHALNPVVIGADRARGAGRILDNDGRLLRPAQDNSGGSYGYGLNVMEITMLDPEHYAEKRLRHITPNFGAGLIGCHHVDALDGQVVMDVRLS